MGNNVKQGGSRASPGRKLPIWMQSRANYHSMFAATSRTFNRDAYMLGLRAHPQQLYQPDGIQQIEPTVSVDIFRQRLAELLQGQEYPEEARVCVIGTGNGQVYVARSHINRFGLKSACMA